MFQYVSDTHLEFCKTFPKNIFNDTFPKAPYLICAGDIGLPSSEIWCEFISWACEKYVHVFYVMGNHEPYGSSIQHAEDSISAYFSLFTNITFLNRTAYTFPDGLRIVGCTLWSPVSPEGYIIMNDGKRICGATRDAIISWNKRDVDYIKGCGIDKNTIVVTHHIPSRKFIHPKHRSCRSPLTSGFANDLDDLVKNARAWIFGHTHQAHHSILETGTLCLCNPLGYPSEQTPASVRDFANLVLDV